MDISYWHPGLTWSTNSDREPKSKAGRALVAALIIGPPQKTEAYSVAQLERQGIIGLYLPVDAPVIKSSSEGFYVRGDVAVRPVVLDRRIPGGLFLS